MDWSVDEGYTANPNAAHIENLQGNLTLTVGEVDGRKCRLVLQKKALKGNPWVWGAWFPDDHTEATFVEKQASKE